MKRNLKGLLKLAGPSLRDKANAGVPGARKAFIEQQKLNKIRSKNPRYFARTSGENRISTGSVVSGLSDIRRNALYYFRHPSRMIFPVFDPSQAGSAHILDAVKTPINRAVRRLPFINKNFTLFPGPTVTEMSPAYTDFLRSALRKKYGDTIPEHGIFGNATGKWSNELPFPDDDYSEYVHPGVNRYLNHSPDSEKSKFLNAINEIRHVIGIPQNGIEYTLGQFTFNTSPSGDIIISDDFDYNSGKDGTFADFNNGSYTGLHSIFSNLGSGRKEPLSQKIKYRVNIGNPKDWIYDEKRFHAYNDPYKKDFPDEFIYNE